MVDRKKTLSVAVATYNEEKNLPGCLDAVRDWVDEIVVVDGGSTDRTVEIAKQYGAKIIETDNPPIFHINKQRAIDACKSEWILQLDADEVVTSGLRKEILKVTHCPSPTTHHQINGYWIPRKNYFLGKWLKKGGQYPDYTLRLYKNGTGYLPCKTVHEQAVVEGETGYLKNNLLHDADPTFARYLKRFDRYTGLLADELQKQNSPLGFAGFIHYFIIKPTWWFLQTFFRHKGFVDGFPGFVFALFSSLRFPVAYIKYWEKNKTHANS